jgi:hypothetical protein
LKETLQVPKNERKISYEGNEFQLRRTFPIIELAQQKNPQSRKGVDPTLNPFYQAMLDSLEDGYGRNVYVDSPEAFHNALRGIDAARKTLDKEAKDEGDAGVGREIRFLWEENGDPFALPKETVRVPKVRGEGSTEVTRPQYPGKPLIIEFYAHPAKPRKPRTKKNDANGKTEKVPIASFQQGEPVDAHGNEV